MNSHQVAQQIQAKVAGVRMDKDISFSILEDEITQLDEWWYVPIQPTRQPAKTSEYFELLAEIEQDLYDRDNMKILFVPVAA